MKICYKSTIIFLVIIFILKIPSISASAVTLKESKIYQVDAVDCIDPFGSNLIAVKNNDKWGFMNTQGEMVIEAKYQEAHNFHEGLAAVKYKGKWGFINSADQQIIKPEYNHTSYYFNNGYVEVEKKGKWGSINKKGKVVVPLKYEEIGGLSEGLASVKIGKKYGFVNIKRKVVIPAKFDQAYKFSNGLAPVKYNSKWGYINKLGKLVIPYKYVDVESFTNGYARVVVKKDSAYFYGVINTKGKEILKTKYFLLLPITDGLAPYMYQNSQSGDLMGYISLKTGKTIFKVTTTINEFSEGYTFGSANSKFIDAIYNKKGKVKYLKYEYYRLTPLKNGYSIGLINDDETEFRIVYIK